MSERFMRADPRYEIEIYQVARSRTCTCCRQESGPDSTVVTIGRRIVLCLKCVTSMDKIIQPALTRFEKHAEKFNAKANFGQSIDKTLTTFRNEIYDALVDFGYKPRTISKYHRAWMGNVVVGLGVCTDAWHELQKRDYFYTTLGRYFNYFKEWTAILLSSVDAKAYAYTGLRTRVSSTAHTNNLNCASLEPHVGKFAPWSTGAQEEVEFSIADPNIVSTLLTFIKNNSDPADCFKLTDIGEERK